MPKLRVMVSEDGAGLVREAATRAGVSVEAFVVRGLEAALLVDGPLSVPGAAGSLSVTYRPRVDSGFAARVNAAVEARGFSVSGLGRAGLGLLLQADADAEVAGALEGAKRELRARPSGRPVKGGDLAARTDLARVRDRVGGRGLGIHDVAEAERVREEMRLAAKRERDDHFDSPPAPEPPDPPQPFQPESRPEPRPVPVWTDAEKRSSGFPQPYRTELGNTWAEPRRFRNPRAERARWFMRMGRPEAQSPPGPTLTPKFKELSSGLPPLVRRTGRLTYPDGTEY